MGPGRRSLADGLLAVQWRTGPRRPGIRPGLVKERESRRPCDRMVPVRHPDRRHAIRLSQARAQQQLGDRRRQFLRLLRSPAQPAIFGRGSGLDATPGQWRIGDLVPNDVSSIWLSWPAANKRRRDNLGVHPCTREHHVGGGQRLCHIRLRSRGQCWFSRHEEQAVRLAHRLGRHASPGFGHRCQLV